MLTREQFVKKYEPDCNYYFDGYYNGCEIEFLNEIYDSFEEAMKAKTCEGCKHKPNDGECYYEPCGTCARFFYDHYELKVTP